MICGYKPKGGFSVPEWTGPLRNLYWVIRCEYKNKSKRRRYYRYVSKEKLRLAELGIDQELILAVCRYLSGFKNSSESKCFELATVEVRQLKLDF